jgi:hypothetical protein
MPKKSTPLQEQFAKNFTPGSSDECWLWHGRTGGGGYGNMAEPKTRRTVVSHRYSYEFYVGPIPAGLIVRHKCDTPRCVNPMHLELGTQADNIADRVRRGRNGFPIKPRKISPEGLKEVVRLAEAGMRQRDIAAKFGVAQRTINCIINRRNGYGRPGYEP